MFWLLHPKMLSESTTGTITTVQLRRLVRELCDHSPQTKIRVRVLGKMWENQFVEIIHIIAGDSVLVHDHVSNQMRYISLGEVAEFEVETKFQEFSPHNHYQVR